MELGLIVIFGLRLLIPLTIFRWPFWGGLASLVVDALDTNIVKLFGVEIPSYVNTDKILDLYYLSIEVVVSLRWSSAKLKSVSILLYVWRLIGVVEFEISGARWLLFVAPNIFEHYFLLVEFLRKRQSKLLNGKWFATYTWLAVVVFGLWLTKIPQELVLHVFEVNAPVETFLEWINARL